MFARLLHGEFPATLLNMPFGLGTTRVTALTHALLLFQEPIQHQVFRSYHLRPEFVLLLRHALHFATYMPYVMHPICMSNPLLIKSNPTSACQAQLLSVGLCIQSSATKKGYRTQMLADCQPQIECPGQIFLGSHHESHKLSSTKVC